MTNKTERDVLVARLRNEADRKEYVPTRTPTSSPASRWLHPAALRTLLAQAAEALAAPAEGAQGEAVAVVTIAGYPQWLVSWLESPSYRYLPEGTKLYTAPPAASVDVEGLRGLVQELRGGRLHVSSEATANAIEELIDSAGGAKGEGCGICGGYCDHPELHTPQPAEGDTRTPTSSDDEAVAIFFGREANGKPMFEIVEVSGNDPAVGTKFYTRPAATGKQRE